MASLIGQSHIRLPNWSRLLLGNGKDEKSDCSQNGINKDVDSFPDIPFFTELTEEEQQVVLNQIELKTFNDGDVICSRGSKSEYLLFIKSGWIKLVGDESDIAENAVGPGSIIGQTEFFLKRPHAKTAKAVGSVSIWTLSDSALTNIFTDYPNIGLQFGLVLGRGTAQFENYLSNQLAKFQLLRGLSEGQRKIVARHLSPHRYLPRETIYRAGDAANGIFFIERGQIWLHSDTDDDYVALGPGNTCGEKALIYRKPHSTTAQAGSEAILWLLSPADFNAIDNAAPSVAATIRHNLFTKLDNALSVLKKVLDSEIAATEIVTGNQSPLIEGLLQVRQTLTWVKNNQINPD